MKKVTLLAILLFATIQFSFAQNTIAKLKFEEAEEAYSNSNFELTLTKLKEVEGLLKSTNPKILYLQILAQDKIIVKDLWKDYTIIENIRSSMEKYLKEYDNLPDNEDKYREIYKISEHYKDAPSSLQDFNDRIKSAELKKAIEKQNEIDKIKKGEEAFMNFTYFKYYDIGLTLEEAKMKFPEYFSKYKTYKQKNNPTIDQSYSSENSGLSLFGKAGKIVGCQGTLQGRVQDDASFTKGEKAVSKFVDDFTAKFNFSPTITVTPMPVGGFVGYIIYNWTKNGKTLSIIYYRWDSSSGYTTSIELSQMDNQILK